LLKSTSFLFNHWFYKNISILVYQVKKVWCKSYNALTSLHTFDSSLFFSNPCGWMIIYTFYWRSLNSRRWFWHQDKICLVYFECSMDQTMWNFITNVKVFSKFTPHHCLKPLVTNLTFTFLCFLSRVCLMLYTHLTLIGFFPSGSSFSVQVSILWIDFIFYCIVYFHPS